MAWRRTVARWRGRPALAGAGAAAVGPLARLSPAALPLLPERRSEPGVRWVHASAPLRAAKRRDPYQVLGIARDASAADIKKAYYKVRAVCPHVRAAAGSTCACVYVGVTAAGKEDAPGR
jgi:hypothetical protein